MNTPKIIITGGSGFIGTHLVNFLRETGHQVVNIESLKENDKTAKRKLLSDTEQSEYDVLYGDPL